MSNWNTIPPLSAAAGAPSIYRGLNWGNWGNTTRVPTAAQTRSFIAPVGSNTAVSPMAAFAPSQAGAGRGFINPAEAFLPNYDRNSAGEVAMPALPASAVAPLPTTSVSAPVVAAINADPLGDFVSSLSNYGPTQSVMKNSGFSLNPTHLTNQNIPQNGDTDWFSGMTGPTGAVVNPVSTNATGDVSFLDNVGDTLGQGMDWLKTNWGSKDSPGGLQIGFGVGQGLLQAGLGLGQYNLAKKSFAESVRRYNQDYAAQRTLINDQMGTKAANSVALAGGSESERRAARDNKIATSGVK